MQTPIADFVREYAKKKGSRFHMPGHKGRAFLGCEEYDLTEIAGADALYEAEGIIAESEKNAAELFGTGRTFFSTEGSSQCIRAMLYLAVNYHRRRQQRGIGLGSRMGTGHSDSLQTREKRPYIIAARNVHKAFLYAAALVDFDVVWLYPEEMHSLCSCRILAEQLETELKVQTVRQDGMSPAAVYVTSPDYLGGRSDIAALAEVCHRYNTVLAVDNAHGAYLHFLEEKQHPIDLGADICCDSAHKTLPVLTGGAYLQVSKSAPLFFAENAKSALALFGSTSPSYLTLMSLDLCNAYLAVSYRERLAGTVECLARVRAALWKDGWLVEQTEPLKLTLRMPEGVTGIGLADWLRRFNVECEYADEEYLVLMATTENKEEDYMRLLQALDDFDRGTLAEAARTRLQPVKCEQRLSIREAIFSEQETVKVKDALGRICGAPTVGCPPAIPIAASGEVINAEAVRLFEYYGAETVAVVR